MAEISDLKRKRGSIKARVTLFQKYIDEFKRDIQNVDDKNIKFQELQIRLEKAEELVDLYENVQSDLEVITDINEESLVERALFEKEYYKAVADARSILQTTNEQSVKSTSSQPDSERVRGIKLPQISLPNFDGNYETWLEYRDTFESLIHKNSVIGEIQKFHYLRASLKGTAAQIIQSLEFTSSNYQLAWSLLRERFDNKRLLIQSHVKHIVQFNSLVKESATELRKLVDNLSKHLRALQNLNQPTDKWDTLLIYLITPKLDKKTVREWEECKYAGDVPTMTEFTLFIKNKADLLETIEINQTPKVNEQKRSHNLLVNAKNTCPACNENHKLYQCKKFVEMTGGKRIELVKRAKACVNCLRSGHFARECTFGNCKTCGAKHNTLLHQENRESTQAQDAVSLATNVSDYSVLLGTACVWALDENQKAQDCRIVLDSCSQSNFITEDLVKKLKLKCEDTNIAVKGINADTSNLRKRVYVTLKSKVNNFQLTMSCLVIRAICDRLPNPSQQGLNLNIPGNIRLADPKFDKINKVSVLIGAEFFYSLLCVGQIGLGRGLPILQKTKFGWVVSGPVPSSAVESNQICNFTKTIDIQSQLERFWEIESILPEKRLTKEELECERYFDSTLRRNGDGRFIVSIPFKESLELLGESRETALKRFNQLEKKLNANIELKEQYVSFMNEYIQLGHMSLIENEKCDLPVYYIPHHSVTKEDSLTTKLRVVFDASCKTNSGCSLNDLQMTGPALQDELFCILLRFRQSRFVVSADVQKMYRQILVASEQTRLQRVFWRANPKDALRAYELQTVTYGTTAASYLAVKCLQKVAEQSAATYPEASERILRDFYMDDLLTGFDTIEHAETVCLTITDILRNAKFELRKFVSNEPTILEKFKTDNDSLSVLNITGSQTKGTLGLQWCCESDELIYRFRNNTRKAFSKRAILSVVSQIFDPLGLLSPFIITAKILLQTLWKLNLTWDEGVPQDVHSEWSRWTSDLQRLAELKITRHVIAVEPRWIELHGFSDASENAYGCCIYARSSDTNNLIRTRLICAKTRVAPAKVISIPRLELSGALLLARLMDKVSQALNVNIRETFYWCDSTIVQAWIRHDPGNLKTFVANRVSEISTLTNVNNWRHVPTQDNPADLLSRGVSVRELVEADFWWEGPTWLKESESNWPNTTLHSVNKIPERKALKTLVLTKHETNELFHRFSSFSKLQRVTAYCLRFIYNTRNKSSKRSESLTLDELNNALNVLTKMCQLESFSEEINRIKHGKGKDLKGPIVKLSPFVDETGILRVGGRLHASTFQFNKKHPVLLHGDHVFTVLLIEREHIRLLHAGPQQTLYSLRERYWPIRGRVVVKRVVRKCTTCFKVAPRNTANPLMGNLPKHRITVSLPFQVCGVDFAGPFELKNKLGRGGSISKAYLCIFVCFCTKAVHLELVSGLSTEAFLATLKRFVARRGKPSDIYSDNGTNFIGTAREMKELKGFLSGSNEFIKHNLQNDQIEWHFIPPRTPNFGGLWEAGVKSVKSHIKRIVGNRKLTFEGFSTVLSQIEAVLNSRPLSPLSSDPTDFNPLTPAHFLIGRSLTSVPEGNYINIKEARLNTYQKYQQIYQQFWSQWSKAYIGELQGRTKWVKTAHEAIQPGLMVLLKEDHMPPLQWSLGRIVDVHPGADGVVRVVTVKLPSGKTLKRPTTKVCVLPIY